ncbi:MAG: MMPL family transporter [bacterium]|nr:MMPL family transporter [bacterium]
MRWLVACSLLTLFLGAGLLRLEIRSDGAALHPANNPVVQADSADQRTFFESDQVMVLVSARPGGPPVSSPEGLRFLEQLHRSLEAVPGVYARRVRSLATLIDPRPEIPVIQTPDFLDEIPTSPVAHEALLARVAASPLGSGLFLAPGGQAAVVYVPTLRDASRSKLVADTQRALEVQASTFDLRLTGPVTAEVLLGQAVLADLARLVPLMVAVMAVLLFACLRSVAGVLVPMVEVLVVLLCTLGAMGHLGIPITLVTTILPVLLMTVAVTDEIHLLERVRAHLGADDAASEPNRARVRAAMRAALRRVGRPIVLTSLTTSVAFMSFATASLAPLRHFGVFAAIGVLLAMAFSFTLVPATVVLLPPSWFREPGTRRLRHASRETGITARLLIGHGGAAALAGLLLAAGAATGLGSLSVQDSWVENFDPESDLVSAERELNDSFWGSYRFDVVLESPEPLYFMRADGLRLADSAARIGGAGPHVGGALSHVLAYQIVADAWGESGSVFDLPPERIAEIARLLANVSRRTDLDQVLSSNGSSARVRLFVRDASYERAEELRDYLERSLPAQLAGSGVSVHFSGDLPVASAVVDEIVWNMVRSVAWTALGVAVLLLLFFRSLRLALIAFVPLGIGLPALLGCMGHAGMPLGIATSMFAAVTIGVAVDFAIHFAHGYRLERARTPNHPEALGATLASVGRAIRWNALVLALGLAVLAFSSLKPDRSLGLLLCGSMVTCYAATLLFLPQLLSRDPAVHSRVAMQSPEE